MKIIKKIANSNKIIRSFLVLFFVLFLFSQSFALIKVANDPTRITVGARALGMGKAFVGISDDISSAFLNPAGLANLERWQMTSMSGKFINEVNYLNLAGAYPLAKGVAAVSYVGSNIGFVGVFSSTQEVGGVRIIASTTEGGSYNYNDNAMLLSYGVKLSDVVSYELLSNFSFGSTIKLFSQALSGPGVSGGTASGQEIDMGFLYTSPNSPYKLGVMLQNALPVSLGGKIAWASGVEESLPATLKLGGSIKILGKNGLQTFKGHDLLLAMDYETNPGYSSLPSLIHIGAEWTPIKTLQIRLGLDQDWVGKSNGLTDVSSNLTAGVGIFVNGYRIDYGYHQYFSAVENDTHYLSLSYGFLEKAPPQKVIKISSPQDKSINYEKEVKVEGGILAKNVKRVTVNGIDASIFESSFEAYIPLSIGKNGITVIAYDDKDKVLQEEKIKVLSLITFKDVTYNFAKLPIEQLATLNIINGYPDGSFLPDKGVSRAEFVMLLIKLKGIELPTLKKPPFKDITLKHWAVQHIKLGNDLKIVKGYPDKTFRPQIGITRAEGVSVASRFGELDTTRVPEIPFTDLNGRHWAVKEISAASFAGYLKFLEGKPFEPKRQMARGETAEILSHTKQVSDKIENLMNWETGYF